MRRQVRIEREERAEEARRDEEAKLVAMAAMQACYLEESFDMASKT